MMIEVRYEHKWGNHRFYPVNNDAKTLLKMLKRKSLTPEQLKFCKKQGWDVTVQKSKETYNLDD